MEKYDAILLGCEWSMRWKYCISGYIFKDSKGRFDDGEFITTTKADLRDEYGKITLIENGGVLAKTKNTVYLCYFLPETCALALEKLGL